jgi:glycosyltransferase involved in cell wall biosynthesis
VKKKILHIITSIDNGGAENYLVDLIANQIKIYNVFLIYFKGNNYYSKILKDKGVVLFKINFPNKKIIPFFFNFFKLLTIYNKIKPNIVHSHLWLSEIYGLLLKIIFKNEFKFVISKHLDSYIFEGSFGRNIILSGLFLEKIIFKYSDHIIFISNAVKNYFLKKISVKKKKYTVIYYGIDIKQIQVFDNKKILFLRKKFKIDTNQFVIGCVARHVEQKSLDILLRSYSIFNKNNQNIASKLIMIGRGGLTSNLKKLSKSLEINHKIIWIPYVKEINVYYKIFNVLCLSSKYEGLGRVLLEAMASGLPVVASDRGGIPEIIKNKKNGYIVPHGDILNFSKRIKDSLKLSRSKYFRANQLKNIKNNYTLNKVFLETNKVYKKS